MICPKCDSEYQPGFTECAFCHVPLVDTVDHQPETEIELVPLRLPNSIDPVFATSLLSSEGIECIIEGGALNSIAADRGLLGVAGALVNPPRLLVRREDAETAHTLLAEANTGVIEPSSDEIPMPEESARPMERRIGEGPIPPELDRVNWGAVLLGPIWAPVHGLWSWTFAIWAVLLFSPFGIVATLSGLDEAFPVRVAGLSLDAAIAWCVIAVFGLRANRLAWAHESRLTLARADQPLPHRAPELTRYRRAQRRWTAWGFAFLVVGLCLTPFFVAHDAVRYGWSLAVDAVAQLGTLAILYVYDQKSRAAFDETKPVG